MAERGAGGAPYPAVRALAAWAALNWRYLRGRLLQDRIDPTSLTLVDLLDLAFAYLADGYNGWTNPQETRDKLNEALSQSMPERESWGMDVDDEAALPPPAIPLAD